MLNQVVLVGRIVKELTIKTLENGNRIGEIILATPRNFKNSNGEYDTDFIPVVLCDLVADTTKEIYKVGDLIGARGKIQNKNNKIEIIADKITFLSQEKNERKEDK